MKAERIRYLINGIQNGHPNDEDPVKDLYDFTENLPGEVISYIAHFNEHAGSAERIKKLNYMLATSADRHERQYLAKDLLRLLFLEKGKAKPQFLASFFSPTFFARFIRAEKITATISSDGHQLRIWFEEPSMWKGNDISSNKKEALLFGIHHDTRVIQYMVDFIRDELKVAFLDYPGQKSIY